MSLFGNGDTGTVFGPEERHDPWADGDQNRIGNLLAGVDVPPVYGRLFNEAGPVAGKVKVTALQGVLARCHLPMAKRERIVDLVTEHRTAELLDEDTWNVAMALVGLAERTGNELSLDAVDFARDNLPGLSLDRQTLSSATPLDSSGNNSDTDDASYGPTGLQSPRMGISATPEPGSTALGGPSSTSGPQPWTAQTDPSLYTPAGRNTITVALVPEKEGVFMFRHVVYRLEGTVPTAKAGGENKRFSVVRRYSDFLWLLDCLVRKYPFRLLPILPPKRLAVDGRYLSSDAYFLERRRRGLTRFVNQLAKHPLLRQDKLVTMFLTVDAELSVWRKQSSMSVEEEFVNRVISTDFMAQWDEERELNRWRGMLAGIDQALEVVVSLCHVVDRISKRNEAMASDMGRVASGLE